MPTAAQVVAAARTFLGFSEANGKHKQIIDYYNSKRPAGSYKMTYADPWCDAFVSVIAMKTNGQGIIGVQVGVQKHIDIFKQKGIWHENGKETPQVGDILTYNWDDSTQPNDGYADHIGFVSGVSNGMITVIEGNYNDAVKERKIAVGNGYIRGFARPKYDTPAPPSKPSPGKKSVDQIAREVIAGRWGNGANRTAALKKYGYDPAAIQARVNQILKGNSGKKSVDQVAREVIAGKWGNGQTRKDRLKRAGYDPAAVQARVNQLV